MKGGLEEISQRTGLSRSTVSKALNNSGSVSSDTKQSVLEAARALSYEPKPRRRVQRQDGQWLVVAVMPETPSYFWDEALRGMKAAAEKHPDMRLATSLFSRLSEEEDALYCLDYAMELQPDLMIVTPPAGEAVLGRLAEAAVQFPVACFCETAAFDHAFYVGADYAGDGALLGRAAAKLMADNARLLKVRGQIMPMLARRDEAFSSAFQDAVPQARWVGEIDVSGVTLSAMPAQLARDIHERFEGQFDAVYVTQGRVPQVLSALDKLKCPPDIPVFGYERVGRELAGGRAALVLEQDVFTQGVRCVEAAWRYLSEGEAPEDGHVFVPSRLRRAGEAEAIGRVVTVTIDRPLGSRHPEHSDIVYTVNYGYVPGVMAGDGEEQDAYVLGVEEPLASFEGEVIAVIHRLNDSEDKWVVAPRGMCFTKEEIAARVDFVERFFETEIRME